MDELEAEAALSLKVIKGLQAVVDLCEEGLAVQRERGEKFESCFQKMLQGYGQGNGEEEEKIDNCDWFELVANFVHDFEGALQDNRVKKEQHQRRERLRQRT
jgi:hypothetical protein